ncbi:MAG: ABC transporter ATP-binding protein, partial [Bacilli bacterium]
MNIKKSPNQVVTKAKDFKGTIKKLLKYIAKYKFSLILVIIFAISSTIFAIVGPKILGNATTEIFNGLMNKINGIGGIDFSKIAGILLTLIGLYILSTIFSFIQGFIMTKVTQKITYNMRKDIAEKLKNLPMKYFDKKSNGEVLSIITNDVDTLSQSLNQSAVQLITATVTLVGIFAMMLSISIVMTIMALFILPLAALLIMVVVKKSQKYFKRQQDYLGHVNGEIEEMYTGHLVIKAFNASDDYFLHFNSLNNVLCDSSLKSQFLSGLMQPIMAFISNVGYVLVAIVGGYLAIKGKITVGNIQSFIQYMRQFTQPITTIAQVMNMIQSLVASAERIFEFLEEETEAKVISDGINSDELVGNIDFEHVQFGYNDKIVINDFSIKVKNGQKVAIVGPTGAGKTTMVKLLMRFYDVTAGQILIDGHNIKTIERLNLRKIFGMVLQETWLFSGTIMENIRYGRLTASDDEVIWAAKKADIHHFIQTLPNGYNMVINEEANNISQGQKQLLTLARAILANPKILILDEATS